MRIVTTCSARKAVPALPAIKARSLRRGSLEEVATDWLARLDQAQAATTAADLYSGRGFGHAKAAANGTPYIISAGLGLLAP
jgi:hypothetical protein